MVIRSCYRFSANVHFPSCKQRQTGLGRSFLDNNYVRSASNGCTGVLAVVSKRGTLKAALLVPILPDNNADNIALVSFYNRVFIRVRLGPSLTWIFVHICALQCGIMDALNRKIHTSSYYIITITLHIQGVAICASNFS